MDKKLFTKNLNALKNKKLKEKLKNYKASKFKVSIGKDSLDINFISNNHGGGGYTMLYDNAILELNKKIALYNDKYFLYPVLYFFGFGNGILYKALLQNKHHQKIVIFEKELEFIFLSFHYIDFTKELENDTLVILDILDLVDLDFQLLCFNKPYFSFLRIYFLDIHCDYYEKFHNEILQLNEIMQKHIKQSILSNGNSSQDALMGIENFIYNLTDIITSYPFNDLIKKRKNISDNAIIVSTGPSLIKQLPLLKQYQNKASIFCADSAYPILAKEGIKPDYVLSLERVDFTSEFFNNDFGEFDKDILFIIANVTHKNTISFLKRNYREYCFFHRSSSLNTFLQIKRYFYSFHSSPSVANMAYFLAAYLNHKNIIFIGQDLAYAEDGSSHPKEYHYGQYDTYNPENINYNLKTIAYGGKKEVSTTETWNLFKKMLEFLIHANQNTTTYNATEGGARIEGTIEKPFKELCENLLTKDLKKPFAKLDKLNKNKQIELMLKAYYKIHQLIRLCEKLYLENSHLSSRLHFLSSDENNFSLLIDELDHFKNKIEKIIVLNALTTPLNTQFELNLARIYVLNPQTKEDSFNKKFLWIKEHLEWMLILNKHIQALKVTLEQNILRLEKKLEEKGLQKYIQKIRHTKLQRY
ncbi:motility associated factor glycosyltransferase family protein [Campylobacter peloridis]|uniref:Motility associated factor glycosyltransferase family protein n=1 Tax=Campylobacter peloridis TaxID=488546 RepID=A0A5C7DN61_9BACT|nr:motility associated factor glycosyltransferase family protein [Campylobacter peloridis]TXE84414.1 motility associated factor glycosyltransferase family protein [Campylobacter peloridis]